MYITSGSHVKSNRVDISMPANDHDEADSRICLHLDVALNKEANTVLASRYGSDLALGSTSATTTSTQSAKNLGRKQRVFCHLFTPSRVLMQHPSSG